MNNLCIDELLEASNEKIEKMFLKLDVQGEHYHDYKQYIKSNLLTELSQYGREQYLKNNVSHKEYLNALLKYYLSDLSIENNRIEAIKILEHDIDKNSDEQTIQKVLRNELSKESSVLVFYYVYKAARVSQGKREFRELKSDGYDALNNLLEDLAKIKLTSKKEGFTLNNEELVFLSDFANVITETNEVSDSFKNYVEDYKYYSKLARLNNSFIKCTNNYAEIYCKKLDSYVSEALKEALTKDNAQHTGIDDKAQKLKVKIKQIQNQKGRDMTSDEVADELLKRHPNMTNPDLFRRLIAELMGAEDQSMSDMDVSRLLVEWEINEKTDDNETSLLYGLGVFEKFTGQPHRCFDEIRLYELNRINKFIEESSIEPSYEKQLIGSCMKNVEDFNSCEFDVSKLVFELNMIVLQRMRKISNTPRQIEGIYQQINQEKYNKIKWTWEQIRADCRQTINLVKRIFVDKKTESVCSLYLDSKHVSPEVYESFCKLVGKNNIDLESIQQVYNLFRNEQKQSKQVRNLFKDIASGRADMPEQTKLAYDFIEMMKDEEEKQEFQEILKEKNIDCIDDSLEILKEFFIFCLNEDIFGDEQETGI